VQRWLVSRELMYLACWYAVCSHPARVSSKALWEWVEVMWALVMACLIAWRVHSSSYSEFMIFVLCKVCGALLPLEDNTIFSGNNE
jgi:hypothetical protein